MIIKRRVTKGFVQIPNDVVRDKRLALDEHGMLHYLLSLPDDWEVNLKQLETYWKIGRDKRQRIFRALRKTGWAQLERITAEDGTLVGKRWIIGDEPGPEQTDEALSEQGDEDESSATEATAAPESETPDALASTSRQPPFPAVDKPDRRDSRPPENPALSRIKTPDEQIQETNTPGVDARENDEDDGEPPPRFGELLRLWPADNVTSAFACERVFVKLSDRHKTQARDGIKPYLDDCRQKGHNRLCDLRTYLDERRWEKFVNKPIVQRLFVVKRGTPEAERWREHFQKNEPHRLAVFQIALNGSGFTAPSQWPPATGPGTGRAMEAKTEATSLMTAEDEAVLSKGI